MLYEEKWQRVREFYEANYRDQNGLRLRFQVPLTERQVDSLFEQMKRVQATMKDFYHAKPQLKEKLLYCRGHVVEVEKRKSNE